MLEFSSRSHSGSDERSIGGAAPSSSRLTSRVRQESREWSASLRESVKPLKKRGIEIASVSQQRVQTWKSVAEKPHESDDGPCEARLTLSG